jgi:hypothetical protein
MLSLCNDWWSKTDFVLMEEITNYNISEFIGEYGYQEFIDLCDEWWRNLSITDKIRIFNTYTK